MWAFETSPSVYWRACGQMDSTTGPVPIQFWNRKYEMQRQKLCTELWVMVSAAVLMLYLGSLLNHFLLLISTLQPRLPSPLNSQDGWENQQKKMVKKKKIWNASLMYKVKIIQLQSSGWGLSCAHWPCPLSALILASLPSFGSPSYFQPQPAPTRSTPELPQLLVPHPNALPCAFSARWLLTNWVNDPNLWGNGS